MNKVKYDDCRILDKSGKPVFMCDEKKALWYIKQGYGDKVSDNPLTVQFNFDESGEDTIKWEEGAELYNPEFYLKERENICAACSGYSMFARFQTVPHLYRL